ncbi:MAG: hypothetical protein AB7I33_00505 [Gemmatimonadales bacterium]
MRVLTCTLALLLLPALPVVAQDTTRLIPNGFALGATVDRLTIGDSDGPLVSTTLHISSLRRRRLTPEFAVAVFPRYLAEGAAVLIPDVGAAYNLSLPGATVLLRAGASGVFVFGDGFGGALPGVHYGASLLVPLLRGFGLRVDAVGRTFALYESTRGMSLGIGITSLPR